MYGKLVNFLKLYYIISVESLKLLKE